MGKAGKWIRNFLLGKREEKEKDKKRVNSAATEVSNLCSPKAILSVTKEKRRWSFRKSTTTEKIIRRNLSFDSISTAFPVKQVLQEHEIEQIRVRAILVTTRRKSVNGTMPVVTTPVSHATGPLKDAAAIKIQAAFRSYLARKALRALRALVKLQALVRGHLVRKQTTAVIRSMQALMNIQVRARYKRAQIVEAGSEPPVKRTGLGESARNSIETKNVNSHEKGTSMNSKSGPLDYAQGERREPGIITKCRSCRFPTSKLEDLPDQNCWSPLSTVTKIISTDQSETIQTKLQAFTVPLCQENPGYMSYTESSKAKARSHSEPKQRPKKWRPIQKHKRSISTHGLNVAPEVQEQCMPPHSRFTDQENQHPWFMKLYRSAMQRVVM